MMKKWFLLGVLFLSTSAFAFECNYDGNQAELNQCARDDFDKADKALNDTYRSLVGKLEKQDGDVKPLRKAQRAWIAFRDAELDMMFACDDEDMRVCWGSMYPLLYFGAKSDLTEERTRELQKYIDEGLNPAIGE
jgi:uncharacterized protein YecT (DUF1311 family)